MYWVKSKNLKILEKVWFNIPKFLIFSEKDLLGFDYIKNNLSFPLILRSSYSIEDWKKNAFAWIFESFFPIYEKKDYKKWLNICLNADKQKKFKSYIKILHSISKCKKVEK